MVEASYCKAGTVLCCIGRSLQRCSFGDVVLCTGRCGDRVWVRNSLQQLVEYKRVSATYWCTLLTVKQAQFCPVWHVTAAVYLWVSMLVTVCGVDEVINCDSDTGGE